MKANFLFPCLVKCRDVYTTKAVWWPYLLWCFCMPAIRERKHTLPSPKVQQNKTHIVFIFMLDMYSIFASTGIPLYIHIQLACLLINAPKCADLRIYLHLPSISLGLGHCSFIHSYRCNLFCNRATPPYHTISSHAVKAHNLPINGLNGFPLSQHTYLALVPTVYCHISVTRKHLMPVVQFENSREAISNMCT